jgi:hypothetical protein
MHMGCCQQDVGRLSLRFDPSRLKMLKQIRGQRVPDNHLGLRRDCYRCYQLHFNDQGIQNGMCCLLLSLTEVLPASSLLIALSGPFGGC